MTTPPPRQQHMHISAVARLIILCAVSLILASSNSLWTTGFLCIASALSLCISTLDRKLIAKRLLVASIFVLFLWCTLPVSFGETIVFPAAPISIYAEGLEKSCLLTGKIMSIVCLSITLLAPLPMAELAAAFATLRLPHKLILLILFTSRHIHSLTESYRMVTDAARLRGYTPSFRVRKLPTIAALITHILVQSFDRAHRVHDAMTLRGFTDSYPPPLYVHTASTSPVAAAVAGAIITASLCIEFFSRGI